MSIWETELIVIVCVYVLVFGMILTFFRLEQFFEFTEKISHRKIWVIWDGDGTKFESFELVWVFVNIRWNEYICFMFFICNELRGDP